MEFVFAGEGIEKQQRGRRKVTYSRAPASHVTSQKEWGERKVKYCLKASCAKKSLEDELSREEVKLYQPDLYSFS